MQPDVQGRDALQRERQKYRAETKAQFQTSIDTEHLWPAVDASATPPAAQCQAGHEGSQDRTRGQDRIPEQQMQHPYPGHFVKQAADAGDTKEPTDHTLPAS